jgi:transcriptional regulator of acetoin/glycerol metabolism
VCTALVTHARPGDEITAKDVERHCPEVLSPDARGGAGFAASETAGSFLAARGEFERGFLIRRLELHRWNVAEAARSMDVSTATLYRYLQRHGLRQAPE